MLDDDYENIVEIYPKVNVETAHHILLFGCSKPGNVHANDPSDVWDCGRAAHTPKYEYSRPCFSNDEMEILYTWSEGGLPMVLPHGVGFKVGKGTGINYLVLQMHYWNVDPFLHGETDNSGLFLNFLPSWDKRITKSAGILLLVTQGTIPAHKEEHFEVACTMEEPQTIYPISYFPHTHKLGTVVSGYKIDKYGNWHLIGKENPQKPEQFYPIENKIAIEPGDMLAARCTYKNFRDWDVEVGDRKSDEMCDFYMLYYVDGIKPLDIKFCNSPGAPKYFWRYDKKLGKVPKYIDYDASTLEIY